MNPVIGLSLGRIAVGAVAVANPALAARALHLDGAANPQLSYVTRLFGTREIALGLATLVTTGKSRRTLTALGILVDAADAGTGYLGMKEGVVTQKTALTLMVPAVGAVGSGISGLFRR